MQVPVTAPPFALLVFWGRKPQLITEPQTPPSGNSANQLTHRCAKVHIVQGVIRLNDNMGSLGNSFKQ